MNDAEARERGDVREAGGARVSQFAVLLGAAGDVLFTAAVAVHVAFADGWGWPAVLVAASTLVFAVSMIVALVAKRKPVVVVAAVLLALAGMGAAVAAIDGTRRYDALRHEVFGDRAGVRLVEPDSVDGRRMGGAMLSSITASLAAIAAFALAGYLALRTFRPAGPTP